MVNPESVTKETFRTELERLVRNFAANEDELTAPGYTEMQARTQFITPFFRALGWDVENRAAKSYREMDVLEERGPGEGRPDYTFRTGGSAKFFVEAKAPHEDLENERHVLQAKCYAWSTKEVFAVVLTDFEEFRFYDASLEPNPDHPHRGQLLDLTYRQYLDNIDKLWELSRERVAAGSIEVLLPRDKRALRHRKPVDDKFLEDMTRWRIDLAKAVHKRNPDLDAHALTDIVQRLLDRFIFIRVAEDRRIVEKNTLLDRALDWEAMGGRKPLLPMVNDLFHQINDDFNGDIFKPHPCEEIKLTDQALHRIIKELYPPKSPYRFDVIPVDIFGAVYERYLGKIIHVRGKDVEVEDKPEVRKAGGVYYTPKYIVDYIVKNTVGKVIAGKTPKQIEKIKILDPACGSGSFLLGAFQYLIDYHVAYYEKHPKQARVHPLYPDLVKSNGVPRLSIWRKAKILHNNLFGVDLDPQAVEITMMNLYLKALENERDLPQKQHLLPELGRNIRCGNSLIAPNIADEQELSEEELRRLKPFDWRSQTDGFGDILAAAEGPERSRGSSFDAVIGNPPYVRSQALGDAQRRYYEKHYDAATKTYDIYVLFVDRALSLICRNGRVGFILPNKFFTTDYGAGLREKLTAASSIQRIVDFGDAQVFAGAGNYTCLLFLALKRTKKIEYVQLNSHYRKNGAVGLAQALQDERLGFEPIELTEGPAPWTLAVGEFGQILLNLQRKLPTLSVLQPRIFQGLKTSADKVYLVLVKQKKGHLCKVESAVGEKFYIEAALLRPVVKGEHVQRYWIDLSSGLHIIYPYKILKNGRAVLLESRVLKQRFPRAWEYLKEHKNVLEARDKGLWAKRPDWFAYARSQNIGTFLGQKLLLPYMTTRLRVAPDLDGRLFFVNITTGGYGLRTNDSRHHLHYIAGLLNSCLMNRAILQMTNQFRGGYFAVNKQAIQRLPFRPINFPDRADKGRHDKIVKLVDRMLDLHKRKHSGKLSPSELKRVERQIVSTDKEIDELVYELYGITNEERKIIEGLGERRG